MFIVQKIQLFILFSISKKILLEQKHMSPGVEKQFPEK
jgi:hypothetical protein